jgi:hypothetical protein
VRCSILLAVVVSVARVTVLTADDGGLFSEVAMESVFEKPVAASKAVASPSSTGHIGRITGASSLNQALRAAGFDSQEKDGRASFDLDHAGWSFPVSIGVLVDQDRIDCELSLTKIGDDTSLTTETLLALLTAGDTRGASFAYDRKGKRILLRATLSNRSITASELKADLIRLATVAQKHSDIWSTLKGQPASNSKSASNSKPAEAPPKQFSLVGRWSASLSSNEAFAIQIASDATFQLVHLKSGKSTISKGKATRSGDQLKLVGNDKVTLNCSVTQTAGDAFQLAINDAKGKTTATLSFKKAK